MFRGEKIQLAAVQREYLPKYVEWLNEGKVDPFVKTQNLVITHKSEGI